MEAMWRRQLMAYVAALGLVLLVWDLPTIGKKEALAEDVVVKKSPA